MMMDPSTNNTSKSQMEIEKWEYLKVKSESLTSIVKSDPNSVPVCHDLYQLEVASASLSSQHQDSMEEDNGIFTNPDPSVMKKKELTTVRVNRMWAQYNFDSERLERDLNKLIPRGQMEEEVVETMDIRNQIISSTIHHSIASATGESEYRAIEMFENEWEAEKQRLLRSISGQGVLDTQKRRVAIASKAPDSSAFGTLALSTTTVHSENIADPNLFSWVNAESLDKFVGSNAEESKDTWDLVKLLMERKQDNWFDVSRLYLEKQYATVLTSSLVGEKLEDIIVKELSQNASTTLYGSVQSIVYDFIQPRNVAEGEESEPLFKRTTPVWAIVFYLMRAGDRTAVKNVLQTLADGSLLDLELKKMITLICDEKKTTNELLSLSDSLVNLVKSHYSQIKKSSPWKKALLFLSTRCIDGQLLSGEINATIEDFLWFRLSAMSLFGVDKSGHQLQNMITRNGPRHFNGGNDPFLYTRLLLLCNLPVQAFNYLAQDCSIYQSDAVHMMLLLNSSDSEKYPLTIQGNGDESFVVQTLDPYCADLSRKGRITTAIQCYYYRLHETNSNVVTRGLLRAGTVSLLLSRKWEKAENILKELHECKNNFRLPILEETADKIGDLLLAVDLLLEISVDNALSKLTTGLMRAILPPNEYVAQWVERGKKCLSMSENCSRPLYTIQTLYQLLLFTQEYLSRNYSKALDLLVMILPTNPNEISNCVNDYYVLDIQIRDVFGHVSECAVKALNECYKSVQKDDSGQRNRLEVQHNAYKLFFTDIRGVPQAVWHELRSFGQ